MASTTQMLLTHKSSSSSSLAFSSHGVLSREERLGTIRRSSNEFFGAGLDLGLGTRALGLSICLPRRGVATFRSDRVFGFSPCVEARFVGARRSVVARAASYGAQNGFVRRVAESCREDSGSELSGSELGARVPLVSSGISGADGRQRFFQSEQIRHWVTILGRSIVPLVIFAVGILLRTRPSYALGNALGQGISNSGARKQILVSAWTGLAAGCLHTLTGPDHLAALAPLCIGRSKVESAQVGALWGCGHDAGQMIFGIVFLALKDKLHLDIIRTWASRVVGFTLITIGGMGVREAQEVSNLAFEGEAGGSVHNSITDGVGIVQRPRAMATFATGVVHGLQPDALLMILPALALPSRLAGAAFLGMFLGGTVLAMGCYTLFIASCSEALQKKVPGITKRLTLGSALIAIALGSAFILGEFLGVSLFGG